MEELVVHNFCESRLTNYNPPEIYNSYTSLFITIIPFIMGFPKNIIFYNFAGMLAFNGFASFYYHYTLSWSGKQADEISMILATYYGIWGLLTMYYNNDIDKIKWYNGWNGIFRIIFIIVNTIVRYDFLFPFIFGIYVCIALFLIHEVSKKHNYPYKKYICISFIGFTCWVISEIYCNEYTKYGHVMWHLLFPLGFYRLLLNFDTYLVNDMKNLQNTNNYLN